MKDYFILNDKSTNDVIHELIEKYGKSFRFYIQEECEKSYTLEIDSLGCSKEKLKDGTSLFKWPAEQLELEF